MSEEQVETEVSEPQGGDVFNMDGAVESIGDDLFPSKESKKAEAYEPDDIDKELKAELKEEAEEKPVEKAEKEEKAEPEEEKIDLPPSWKKDMEDKWGKLDADTKKYVLQREEQMKEGLEKDRGDANLGRTMRDLMTPYQAVFQAKGIDSVQAVQSLLGVHNTLEKGTLEQKQALLQKLSEAYGVTKPAEGQDPQIASLMQKMNLMEQNLSASHQRAQQATRERINTEVEAFASTHPSFDELSDDIAKLINAGYELEEAYEKALWANPVTREKQLESIRKEEAKAAAKQAKEEAEQVLKAKSVNIKNRDTKVTPTAKTGKMFDDMPAIMQEIKSRNR